jgi:signal transduction histidine kinase
VQQALDEAARLAQRIYPPLLEPGGLGPALRAAAAGAGARAAVDVTAGVACPPEVAAAICQCWLEALERADGETRVTITVRDEDGAVAFEVVGDGPWSDGALEPLRDRVEALGGRLTGDGAHVSGRVPRAE